MAIAFGGLRLVSPMAVNLAHIYLLRSRATVGLPFVLPVTYRVAIGGDAALLSRARLLLERGQHSSHTRAIASSGLARVYADGGRIPDAIREWHDALGSGYNAALTQLELGNFYAHSDSRDLALVHWMSAIGQRPHDWIQMARRVLSRGQGASVHASWRDAAQILLVGLQTLRMGSDDRAALHIALSDIYVEAGQFSDGLEHARWAVDSAPANAAAHAWLARYLQSFVGDATQVLVHANLAVQYGPHWRAFLVLGDMQLAACDTAEAIAAYETGLKLDAGGDWRHSHLVRGLGYAHWESGDSAAAITSWQWFFTLQPNNQGIGDVLSQANAGTLPRRCIETDE